MTSPDQARDGGDGAAAAASPVVPAAVLHAAVPMLVLVGAVFYTSWVLAPWVAPGGLDPVRTYASELAATDQPGSWVFRLADVIAGLLVGVAAWAGLSAVRGSRVAAGRGVWGASWAERRVPLGWASLLVFGVATVADASSPLSCAPSADAACAAREAAFQVPWTHTLHVGTSVLASLGMLGAILLLTPTFVRREAAAPRALVVLLAVGGVGNVLGTAWTMLEVSRASVAWPWPATLGVAQRVQVGSASLWLLALGLVLLRALLVRRACAGVGGPVGG